MKVFHRQGLTAESGMNRISLASFEHKEQGCATPKGLRATNRSRPGNSRKATENTRHHPPRSALPPPTSPPHNRIECARQAKPLPSRITTDLTLSRPPLGRRGVSADGPHSLEGASSPGLAFRAGLALGCRPGLDAHAGATAALLISRRSPQPHGPPWGFVLAVLRWALAPGRSAAPRRAALAISAQRPSAASTNLPPTLPGRCHA